MDNSESESLSSKKTKNIFDWDEQDENISSDSFSNLTNFKKIEYNKSRDASQIIENSSKDINLNKEIKNINSDQTIDYSENSSKKSFMIKPSIENFQKVLNPLKDSVTKMINNQNFSIQKATSNVRKSNSICANYVTPVPKRNINYDTYSVNNSEITIQNMILNNKYSFNSYKSLIDKEKLLISALDTKLSKCIIKVILFLKQTLDYDIFKILIEKYPEAVNEYKYYVKSLNLNNDLEILNKNYNIELLLSEYKKIIFIKDNNETIIHLEKLIEKYKGAQSLFEYIEHIKLHVKYMKICSHGNTNELKQTINEKEMIYIQSNLIDMAYIQIEDYLKRLQSIPYELKKAYNLNDIQFEYIIIKSFISLKQYERLKRFYIDRIPTGIFSKNTIQSSTLFEYICYFLHSLNTPEDIIGYFVKQINNKSIQLNIAENLELNEILFYIHLENKNKAGVIEISRKICTSNENLYKQIIQTLSDPKIKWK